MSNTGLILKIQFIMTQQIQQAISSITETLAETNKILLKVKERLRIVETENCIFKIKKENKRLKINLPKEFKGDKY